MKNLTLDKEKTGVVIIDVQIKLMDVIAHKNSVIENIKKFIFLSKLYNLPNILTEQYPRWLGPTVVEITESLESYDPIEKIHFNCCDENGFNKRLESENVDNIILTGVESHICVFQTCMSLLKKGYGVHVPFDAVGSRNNENLKIGLDLMKESGAVITSTETIIYQLLEKAGTKEFKEMLKMLR